MSTISHPPAGTVAERAWTLLIRAREMWASLAIFAMWAAVAISAVWGPDFVSTSGSGATNTTIPSGVIIAMFATIGTWFVAKYGLARRGERSD